MALFFIHFYLKAPPSLIWYLCDEEHPTYTQRSPEHLILIFPLRVELWLSVSLSREASCAESFKWRSRLVTLGDRDQLAGKEAVPLEDLPGDCGRLRRRSLRGQLVHGLESATSKMKNGHPLESTWSLRGSKGSKALARWNEHGTIYAISSDFGDRMTTQHLD